MRLCYIALGTFPHVDYYLDYFTRLGHDVFFISLTPGPSRSVPTYNVGIGSDYSRTSGKWKYPFSMLRARRIVAKLRPHVLHALYATSGGTAGLISGFHPFVVSVHGSDILEKVNSHIIKILLRRIFNSSDCIIAVSQQLEREIAQLGIDAQKIHVLTHGIDTDEFSFSSPKPVRPDRPLRLICTRRFETAFDNETIIRSLALLKAQNFDFHITFAAGGSLLAPCKKLAESFNLHENITFLGGVGRNEIASLLREKDVFLSASLWDGTSLSLLEAMATGIFPIVSDIKANRALLTGESDAFLHTVGDPEDLASCIRKVQEYPEMFTFAAKRNRRKVESFGDRKKNMQKLAELYHQLVATNK